MSRNDKLELVRAELLPHGLFLRGVVHFEGDGPRLPSGLRADTVVLLGNIGGSIWPAFAAWRRAAGSDIVEPLDTWSKQIIQPVAERLEGTPFFPSEKPWQPFQQWAARAEGLQASPLGILIHPEFGLWHGYRGAIGFAGRIGVASVHAKNHPCDSCADKPCLTACPVGAVRPSLFDVVSCRSHIRSGEGQAGCMVSGCLARNACPIGIRYRYDPAQLRFHMNALG